MERFGTLAWCYKMVFLRNEQDAVLSSDEGMDKVVTARRIRD